MEVFMEERFCKYCQQKLELCTDEGLECLDCKESVHLKCLRRGSVPGGLHGDVFYTFTCQDCSSEKSEVFTRNKISWLQIISLVLYHLQNKSPGLARKGFFHWRHHIATFIDKNWEMLVPSDIKKKKAWTGTVAGTLSHFSGYIFLSGTAVINEQAWWALMYPKLSPYVLSSIYSVMTLEKQVIKSRKGQLVADAELFQSVLPNCIMNEEFLEPFVFSSLQQLTDTVEEDSSYVALSEEFKKNTKSKNSGSKRKHSLTNFGNSSKMLMKLSSASSLFDELNPNISTLDSREKHQVSSALANEESKTKDAIKLLDPLCHYNTSLNNLSQMKGVTLQVKLTGGIRQELILSPYSAIYLKPYIRRDVETFPAWLKLMAEIQIVANSNDADYVLPARAPIDYTYVQPEHIPAINSLCNQFFWPGIDLTESLQYPDFSCVALYKRLIIGFAFLVPDVTYTENYLSFLFTRPAWRNCGIAKFMIYHLIQTSLGKDITLHVSINSPALFLYQKFGFKVENVVLDFYDKYWRSDVKESKHAFFCRLER